MSMDLDKDYTVNGHVFKAGKGVDVTANQVDADGKTVKSDFTQAIKDMQAAEKTAADFGGHTSAVPTEEDPTTPTSGTPTFPVGTNQAKENAEADKEEENN